MSFKHFMSENKKPEDTFEYKRGLGMAQAFYGDKHNSKTDKEDFDDTCREIAKKVGIKDSKEIEAFVRWMETKMSFNMSKGKPMKEADDKSEKMFGMSKEELNKMIDEARSKKFLAMGILSDIQEVISDKKIQQKLNIVKYIIDHNIH